MAETVDGELAHLIELEQQLLKPEVRLDPEALSALLHEDFCEFGASGLAYDRASIIEALVASYGASANAFDFKAVRLSPDVVLLTCRTDSPSLRTSIWSRADAADGTWRLLHHQGIRTTK